MVASYFQLVTGNFILCKMHKFGRGDDGFSELPGGGRVPKYDLKFEVLGAIDEATSSIGVARAGKVKKNTAIILKTIQSDLYNLMSDLATRFKIRPYLGEEKIAWVEKIIKEFEKRVRIPKKFVFPGDNLTSAHLDFARAVVRRAERLASKLYLVEHFGNPIILAYLNRLSSLLFILARYEEGA